MFKKSLFLVSILSLLASLGAFAAPVAEDDQVPIDLRRTTLVVRDIDTSLEFYRDALGLEVIYDKMIRNPRDAKTDEESTLARRLVFLRANDDYIGVIGLLQYTKPLRPAPNQGAEPFTTGSMVLVFNAEDVDTTFAKAREVNGVRVLSKPSLTHYPSYDGKSTIAVKVSTVTDPDGFVIELNQLMQDLR